MQANNKDKYIPKTGELVHSAENMQGKPQARWVHTVWVYTPPFSTVV